MFCFGRCQRHCKQITILNNEDCGIEVTSTPSAYCTRVCCRVTYTVTVKNNCSTTANDVRLHVPLDGVFCLDPTSVTVNGAAVEVNCLDSVPVGDLPAGETATVVYTVTIMEYKRYIRSRVLVTFYTCCCCQRSNLGVYSNVNCLQVCPCCCCCETNNNQA